MTEVNVTSNKNINDRKLHFAVIGKISSGKSTLSSIADALSGNYDLFKKKVPHPQSHPQPQSQSQSQSLLSCTLSVEPKVLTEN